MNNNLLWATILNQSQSAETVLKNTRLALVIIARNIITVGVVADIGVSRKEI